jgi:hypothetical protein
VVVRDDHTVRRAHVVWLRIRRMAVDLTHDPASRTGTAAWTFTSRADRARLQLDPRVLGSNPDDADMNPKRTDIGLGHHMSTIVACGADDCGPLGPLN